MDAGAQTEGLQARYEKLLVTGMKLKGLPARPRFNFCSADLAFCVNWKFTRDEVGDDQASHLDSGASDTIAFGSPSAATNADEASTNLDRL